MPYAEQTEGEKSYNLSVSFTDTSPAGRGKIICLPNIMGDGQPAMRSYTTQ